MRLCKLLWTFGRDWKNYIKFLIKTQRRKNKIKAWARLSRYYFFYFYRVISFLKIYTDKGTYFLFSLIYALLKFKYRLYSAIVFNCLLKIDLWTVDHLFIQYLFTLIIDITLSKTANRTSHSFSIENRDDRFEKSRFR